MSELVLIQAQLKRQHKIKAQPFLRWKLNQEQANAATKALGEALKASK
jgi:hypothetical protein